MAESRVTPIEAAHTQAVSGPQQFTQQLALLNGSILALQHDVAELRADFWAQSARTSNVATKIRNQMNGPHKYQPLVKETRGDGRPLAEALRPAGYEDAIIQPNLLEVNTLPGNFTQNTVVYSHANILSMVAFYNDSFAIVPEDPIDIRCTKFQAWLTGTQIQHSK